MLLVTDPKTGKYLTVSGGWIEGTPQTYHLLYMTRDEAIAKDTAKWHIGIDISHLSYTTDDLQQHTFFGGTS